MSRMLSWALLVAWIAVIWGHSLVPAVGSDAESLSVVDALAARLPMLSQVDRDLLNHIVRKSAHFAEYLILALLAINALRPYLRKIRRFASTLSGFWVLIPSIDETIQRFVPGRAGMLRDVALDMSGFACGALLWWLLGGNRYIRRIRR